MKNSLLTLLAIVIIGSSWAQDTTRIATKKYYEGDTAMAAKIIDNYLSFVDFEPMLNNRMLKVVSYVVDADHPKDTLTIYRWYGPERRLRVELWQKGRMQDAIYSNGKSPFKRFNETMREWLKIGASSYYDVIQGLDIRGALYNWRSKGAEAYYMGEYEYEGHPVYRVYVSTPNIFDRNYFFEKETGLLFVLTEEDRLFGDAEAAANAQRVDWRAWHEFFPLNGYLLPSVESYQVKGQVVVLRHSYTIEPVKESLFTEDTR